MAASDSLGGKYVSNLTLYAAETHMVTVWQLGGFNDGMLRLSVLNYTLSVLAASVDPMQSWAEGPGLVTATVGQVARFWVSALLLPCIQCQWQERHPRPCIVPVLCSILGLEIPLCKCTISLVDLHMLLSGVHVLATQKFSAGAFHYVARNCACDFCNLAHALPTSQGKSLPLKWGGLFHVIPA